MPRPQASRSGSLGVGVAVICAAIVAGCQPSRPLAFPNAAAPSGGPVPASAMAADEAALTLWKRTVDAPRTTPVRASVVVTRFYADNQPPAISRYELLEAVGGRKYRITYHAPASAAGRIVLCDGQTLWQYEPNHDTVLRRAVSDVPGSDGAFPSPNEIAPSSTPVAKGDESGTTVSDLLPTVHTVHLEAEADSVAGRATQVLARYAVSPGGQVVERRWVDIQTGRTLRTEQYDVHNKKRRRVEMTQVEFAPKIAPGEFTPLLAEGVNIVDTTRKNSPPQSRRRETEAAAQRAHFPLRAHGFTLRSASTTQTPFALHSMEVVPAVNADAPLAAANTTHLVYSDGAADVSVFVTPTNVGGTSDNGAVLTGAAGWKPALLKGAKQNRKAWTQETPTRTALAWTQNQNRVIAVAQLPLRELVRLVEALANGSRE